MNTIAWKWLPDGIEITAASQPPKVFKFRDPKADEIFQWVTRLATTREVFVTLREAQVSFAAGNANYAGAVKNLENLLVEQVLVSQSMEKISRDVAVFFEPTGLGDLFGDDVESLIQFGQEAAKNLKIK